MIVRLDRVTIRNSKSDLGRINILLAAYFLRCARVFDVRSKRLERARLLDFAYADVAESATTTSQRGKEAKRTAPGDEGGLCPRRKRGPFFMDDVA